MLLLQQVGLSAEIPQRIPKVASFQFVFAEHK